jgi:Fur family ferric uptake transcriptional regulator
MTKIKRQVAGGKRDFKQIEALAEAQLRRASVRITAARIRVLTALLDAHCAFSHQDVQETLTDMDRVTLYRALECLTDAGLAHKIADDDRVFRYSAGTEYGRHADLVHTAQHQHGHFKCTRCTRVFCLDGSSNSAGKRGAPLQQELQNALQATLGKGFQSHDIALTIKGWCADCAH